LHFNLSLFQARSKKHQKILFCPYNEATVWMVNKARRIRVKPGKTRAQ
jgi:hypothetical protein